MRLNKVPSNANILFTHYSRSLEKIISRTAKKSNNLYARHLLLLLGAKMYGAPSTLAKGSKAVEYILRSKGALGQGALRIDNGSGLSRTSKLSAKLLAKMYDNAYSRYGMRWMKTLSIAGVDGTIKRRFRGTVVKNRAWMKTGTLNRVKNIGGYVKSRSGRMYTVVILVNTKQGRWKAAQLQNNILKWLVTYKGRGTKRVTKTVTPSKSKIITETSTKSAPKKSAIVKSSGSYYIQTGAFSQEPTSEYLSSIKELGLLYSIEFKDNYKVFVGPYNFESTARMSLKKVRKHINKGAFLVHNKTSIKSKGATLY